MKHPLLTRVKPRGRSLPPPSDRDGVSSEQVTTQGSRGSDITRLCSAINSDGLHTAAALYKPKPVLCNVPCKGVRCFKEERRHDLCKSTTQKSITKLCFVTFWSFFKKTIRYKHKCIHSAMFKYTVMWYWVHSQRCATATSVSRAFSSPQPDPAPRKQ